MATLTYAEHKTNMENRRDALQLSWQICGGSGAAHTLYFYTPADGETSSDAGKITVKTEERSDWVVNGVAYPNKVWEWTGVGSVVDAMTDWRSANSSATSGVMFEAWEDIETNDPDVDAEKTAMKTALDAIIADIPNVQALLDADPEGSIEV